ARGIVSARTPTVATARCGATREARGAGLAGTRLALFQRIPGHLLRGWESVGHRRRDVGGALQRPLRGGHGHGARVVAAGCAGTGRHGGGPGPVRAATAAASSELRPADLRPALRLRPADL